MFRRRVYTDISRTARTASGLDLRASANLMLRHRIGIPGGSITNTIIWSKRIRFECVVDGNRRVVVFRKDGIDGRNGCER